MRTGTLSLEERNGYSNNSRAQPRPHDLRGRADPDGGKTGKFHYPLTVAGYRAIYRGYLADPDLQDARAGWPFVAMWDNHEFSWQGWQSIQKAGGPERPGQRIKVAANQAWFECLPARVAPPSGSLERTA